MCISFLQEKQVTHSICSFLSSVIDCLALPDPANGSVDYDSTTFGSVATYSCSSGYEPEGGNTERTCLSSGQWSGEEAQCGGMATGCMDDHGGTYPCSEHTSSYRH